jgi:2-oxo-hept-3-ene-1,7-dioate hydratase
VTAVVTQAEIDGAMKEQLRRFRDALASGMPRLGWKIGINDPKLLERLGLTDPVVGWLDGRRALRSGEVYMVPPGARVALEAEVAVRVGGGGAPAAVAPAFELVNYSRPANSLEGVIEQNIFHDAVVLGRETLAVPIAEGEWPTVICNGVEITRRDPSMLVLQPTKMIKHVATVVARYNEHLETGDWLILGTLVQPIPVHAGDRIEADFGPLGRVAVEIWK